ISGAIIDCFFPERKLSFIKDVSLGKYAVEKMALSDPRESKIVEGLKVLKEYVDLEDPDMMNYARFLVNESSRSYDDISQNPIFLAIKQVSILDGPEKEVATLAAKQSLGLSYDEKNAPKDYYGALMKAMEESEANQPLGILVAERASELDIPFILATSTYHHDILTQPIQDYASRNEWTLVDCGPNKEDDKASPEFWERAFRELEKKLR
ncbi:MAG: hypothetical protein KKG13_02290, partial [Nanoarchaeota archaeon]|nr:hypothetical protein [Nanoarchaeota archaeon]